MADFLADGKFLDVVSPVAPLDLGIWTQIAELAFKQSQAQYDMLDKARANLASTPAVLLGDLEYKKQKTEKLNAQIAELTGTGSFMSPKNIGKVRSILSDNMYDPELEAIKNRTTRIKEVQDRIDKDQLPLANYYDFFSSIENANNEFLASNTYNPNPNIKYNVTPYTNINKTMMEVVDKIPEISDAQIRFTQDGSYAYIEKVKGRDPSHTMAALTASLGAAEWQQYKADYDYLSKVSPASLTATEDIKDGSGNVVIKKGDVYTFDQYVQSEVLKITAAVTGQSREINDLQQSVQSKMEMKQMEIDAELEKERIKKGGKEAVNQGYYSNSIGATTVPVQPINTGQKLSQDIANLSTLKEQLANEEATLSNLQNSGVDVTTKKGEVAALRAKVQQLEQNVKSSSKVITDSIPENELTRITFGNNRLGGTVPAYKDQTYTVRLGSLEKSLTSLVNNGSMDAGLAKKLLNRFPIVNTYKDSSANLDSSKEYVSWLLSTDLDKFEADLKNSQEYKAWDESSWLKGPWAETLVGDQISTTINTMRLDKDLIRNNYKSTIQKIEKVDKQVANVQMLTAPDTYVDGEGKAVKHDLALLNEEVTNMVLQSPASWVDFRTGMTLDQIIKKGQIDINQTKANVTNGFIDGKHAIAVSVYSKATGTNNDNQFQETILMYNPTDQTSTASRTAAALARGGNTQLSEQFQADLNYLVPLQQAEPTLANLPNTSTIDDAITKGNYAAVTMGGTPGQDSVEMLIYKVNDSTYFVGSRVNGNVNVDKTTPYTNLRDISKALYYRKYSQEVGSQEALQNKLQVNAAIGSTFRDIGGPQREYMLNTVGFETAGTYSPAKINETSKKAVGLIQFYPTGTDAAGGYYYEFNIPGKDGKKQKRTYTQAQMQSLDINSQVYLMKTFYDDKNIDPNTFQSSSEAWLAVFLPEVYKTYSSNRALYKTKTFNELVKMQKGGEKLLNSLAGPNAGFVGTAIANNETMAEFLLAAESKVNPK